MLGLGQKLSSVLKHSSVSLRGALFHGKGTEKKLGAARSLCVSLQRYRKLQNPRDDDDDDDVEINQPLKFSTSKASHRVWSVDRSFGNTKERPWWRVLPLSVFCACFLLWCVFRKESQIDKQLEKELDEHIPGILSGEDDTKEDETRPDS
ncbi:ubiquinol-cytochrome c reductase complex assembly factor 4 [Conger conger]|uniref:ubiquinol-cytochrome c reductase complex assembly factor 4 n=1 Tax=Conger conger TaxID=82655 RepID=UPI002A59FC99|nr:ubiquinol-cytochrome c reductase complex assembly factor 4 [Conger conger]